MRFSVLHEEDGELVMATGDELFPALGHSLEGRQRFRLPVDESFGGLAYRTGRVHASDDLRDDDRFRRHPRARRGRDYRSIVSIPLRAADGVDAVLNVIATAPRAFTRVDRTYLTLLAAVVDVARTAAGESDEPEADA